MFIPLQLERSFPLTSHLLAGVQKCAVCACIFQSTDHSAVEDQETGNKHEGEEWSFSRVESAAGGHVCAAAPELSRFCVPAGSTERAGRGAGQVGRPDAGAVTELQAARRSPAHGPWRGWRAEEAPPEQTKPEGRTNTKPRREGYADADDILHGSCKFLNVGSFYYEDCRLFTVHL